MEEKQKSIRELDMNIKRLNELSETIDNDILKITAERFDIETQVKILQQNKKRLQEKMNHYNKRIDDEKKLFKKVEYESGNLKNNIKELETTSATTLKFLEEKKKENDSLQVHKKSLEEEQHIFVGQLVKKGLEEKNM